MLRTALVKSRATVVAILLLGGSAMPSVAEDAPILPTEQFHKIIQSLIDAENRADGAAMAALFTEDAILLPPGGGQPIQGRDNIRKFLTEYVKQKMENHTVTPTALVQGGPNSMMDAGTWSADLPVQNGAQATHVVGTYLSVGVYVDGQWKLWATSWQGKSDPASVGLPTAPAQGASLPSK